MLNTHIGSGSRPETDADFLELKSFNTILNLERKWFEFLHGINNREVMMTVRHGMTPISLPMSDATPPTFEELDTALQIIILGFVFFHCLTGKDRTGMVRACYRVKVQGWTVDTAINEMLSLGMHYIYRPFWVPHLREYLVR